MINISKSGNAIKFAFTDSDHYLYGNGEIEVPVNSLSLIVDESNMVTFRKANSNDIFLSFNPANSNLSDKAGVINFYKTNMVGSTGGGSESGITSGEVQTMIDESLEDYYDKDEVDAGFDEVNSALTAVDDALSAHTSNTHMHVTSQDKYNWNNKAEMSAVTAVASDVSTLSGQVATKVNTTDFSAYSAATDARIAEDEEVTAAALNNLDERIGDPYQKVSGLTIQYNIDGQTPEVAMEFEDDELGRVSNLFNKWGLDAYSEDEETGHQSNAYMNNDGSMGVFEHTEGQEGNEDEGMSYDKQLDLHPDSLEFNTQTNGTDYEQSENVTISKDAITMYKNTNDNGDITESTIEINNNQGGGDGVFINLNDGSKALDLNTTNFDWTDGSDVRQLNWGDIASLNDIDAAISGKADTSAVTAVNDALTAHTSDTGIHVTQADKTSWNAKAEPYSAGTGIEISGNVISATGGGSVTVDSTLDSGSTNPVANSAITNGFNEYTLRRNSENGEVRYFYVPSPSQPYGGGGQLFSNFSINGRCPLTQTNGTNSYIDKFNLVETSAITSAMTSSSTDAQVPSAKAVYDTLGGLKLVKLTQSEYDQLATKDPDTLYIITNVVS